MNKSALAWEQARQWCVANPGKIHGIVRFDGAFLLTWAPTTPEVLAGGYRLARDGETLHIKKIEPEGT